MQETRLLLFKEMEAVVAAAGCSPELSETVHLTQRLEMLNLIRIMSQHLAQVSQGKRFCCVMTFLQDQFDVAVVNSDHPSGPSLCRLLLSFCFILSALFLRFYVVALV